MVSEASVCELLPSSCNFIVKDKMAKDDGHRKMSGFVRESEGDLSENDQVVTCSFDGAVPDSVSKRKNRRGQRSRRR